MHRPKTFATLALVLAFTVAATAQNLPLRRSLLSHATGGVASTGAHGQAPTGLGSNPFLLIDYPRGIANQYASGINDKGRIVGVVGLPDGSFRGYLLQGTAFKDIMFPGAPSTGAFGINKSGVIVGVYCDDLACNTSHGFMLKGKTYTSLDVPGGMNTEALAVNAGGDVVGSYQTPDGLLHGFLLHAGLYTSFDAPGALGTNPLGINDHGAIVGGFWTSTSGGDGFILQNGTFTQIDYPGAVGTQLYGMNNAGEVVGGYVDVEGGSSHAFLLSAGVFTSFDVPFPGVTDTGANAINNKHQIVGLYGIFPQDYFFGYVTTY